MLNVGQEVWVVCRSTLLGTRKVYVNVARRWVVSSDDGEACVMERRALGVWMEFWSTAEVYPSCELALVARQKVARALQVEGWQTFEGYEQGSRPREDADA